MELAEGLVVLCHGAFALKHMDLNRRLIVGGGGECLALAGRNGCVGFDELSHDTAEGLDAYRQRHNVEELDVLVDVARKHGALDGGTYGNYFIGIYAL